MVIYFLEITGLLMNLFSSLNVNIIELLIFTFNKTFISITIFSLILKYEFYI